MNSIERACLSRVRFLALVAMTRAGGTPAPWQLRRAIAPLLGQVRVEPVAAAAAVVPAAVVRVGCVSTVDTRRTGSRRRRARRATGRRDDRRA
jgi:hypothetical protein